MMTLQQQQTAFAADVIKLLQFIFSQGYEVTLGEVYRTPEQAAINVAKGIGIKDSLHIQRLAIDLQLFKNGKYLTGKSDYYFAGTFWETLDKQNRWGGFFVKNGKPWPDSGHFERKPL